MNKLRKEIEFLERGMQRVGTKFRGLQQDSTVTPSMSIVVFYYVDSMELHSISKPDIVIDKDREDPLEHRGLLIEKKWKHFIQTE